MKKLIKNRKGDIPVTILVLGVILICVLTIGSFLFASTKVAKNFDIQAVKEVKLAAEKAQFYENLGMPTAQIDQILGVKTDEQGRYLLLDKGFISVRYNLP